MKSNFCERVKRWLRLNWKTLGLFVLILVFSNIIGFVVGGLSYSKGVNSSLMGNPFEKGKDHSINSSFDILSKDNILLVKIYFTFEINSPVPGSFETVRIRFSIQPVILILLFNLRKMFDYLEFEVLQISVSTDNKTNYALGLANQNDKFVIESLWSSFTSSYSILIPDDWENSTMKIVSILFGNFKIVDNSEFFNVFSRPDPSVESSSYLTEINFDSFLFEQNQTSSSRDTESLYITKQVRLIESISFKIVLVIILEIIALALLLDFSNDLRKIKLNRERDYLRSRKLEIDKEEFIKFIKRNYRKTFNFQLASFLLVISFVNFFVSQIIFPRIIAPYYIGLSIFFSIVFHLLFVIFSGLAGQTGNEILSQTGNTTGVNNLIKEVKGDFELSTKELISTILTVIALVLFLAGSSSFQNFPL